MMKFPVRPTVLALLAAGGFLGGAALAQSEAPALPSPGLPSDGVLIDADEMAAIQKARERCRSAGSPTDQQACMNQAQIEYYRARDAAGAGAGSGKDAPNAPSADDSDADEPRSGSGSGTESERAPQAL